MNAVILRYIGTMADVSAAELGVSERDRALAWRAEQLMRLVPTLDFEWAETLAYIVDWHELERMIAAGCDPRVALRILV